MAATLALPLALPLAYGGAVPCQPAPDGPLISEAELTEGGLAWSTDHLETGEAASVLFLLPARRGCLRVSC